MTKKNLLISTLVLVFILVGLYGYTHFATDRSVRHALNQISQNALSMVKQQGVISLQPAPQKMLADNFITHYFAPWQDQIPTPQLNQIKKDLLEDYANLEQHPGMGANRHNYPQSWVKNLEKNADLNHFPNYNQNAITIHDASIRILPTNDPSFEDLNSVSKGYPFDNLQQTFVPVGTPLHIVHISKDQSWYLVMGCSYSGWIPEQDVAEITPSFKKSWETGTYAVSLQDNIPIFDEHHRLRMKTRIGVLYPVNKINTNDYEILTTHSTATNEASILYTHVSKQFLTLFPMSLSNKNIAQVANNLMGKPYGWGGIYGYRDCSSTTRDLFATFGLWLPRNSADQIKTGDVFSFKGLSDKQKEKLIITKGIPFLTLIHIPGHIVLYVGQKDGHPLVFQNIWGLHIMKLFNHNDRVVIGATVITPLNFGTQFINTTLNHLSASDSMTVLLNPSTLQSK